MASTILILILFCTRFKPFANFVRLNNQIAQNVIVYTLPKSNQGKVMSLIAVLIECFFGIKLVSHIAK
ncbi:MAG: hypothetical protein ACI94Z_000826 [Yoonia sp.]|jgi:hypothetical protein